MRHLIWALILCIGCASNLNTVPDVAAAKAANDSNAAIIKTLKIPEKPLLASNTNTIDEELDEIDTSIAEHDEALVAADKKIAKLNDNRFLWLSVLCFMCIGLGTYIMISGRIKIGIGIAAGSFAILIAIYLINTLLQYIWIVGIILVAAIIVSAIYFGYLLVTKNKVIGELITTTQIVKGDKPLTETTLKVLNTLQSPETQTLVKTQKTPLTN